MPARSSLRLVVQVAGAAVAIASGCARPTEGVVVAPHVDRHPPAQSADGEVIGADRKSPEHSLAEGVSTDHLAPGWKADEDGLEYAPKRDPAGRDPGSTHLSHQDGGAEVVPSR
jgi:hypothetical protein